MKLNKHKILIPGLLTLHFQPFWKAWQQLSGSECLAGACWQASCKVCKQYPQDTVGYNIYKTFSFQVKSETTWCLRRYRVRIYARSALAQGTINDTNGCYREWNHKKCSFHPAMAKCHQHFRLNCGIYYKRKAVHLVTRKACHLERACLRRNMNMRGLFWILPRWWVQFERRRTGFT